MIEGRTPPTTGATRMLTAGGGNTGSTAHTPPLKLREGKTTDSSIINVMFGLIEIGADIVSIYACSHHNAQSWPLRLRQK